MVSSHTDTVRFSRGAPLSRFSPPRFAGCAPRQKDVCLPPAAPPLPSGTTRKEHPKTDGIAMPFFGCFRNMNEEKKSGAPAANKKKEIPNGARRPQGGKGAKGARPTPHAATKSDAHGGNSARESKGAGQNKSVAPTHIRKKQKAEKKPLVTKHGPREQEHGAPENITSLPSRRRPKAPAIISGEPIPASVTESMRSKTPMPQRQAAKASKNSVSRHTPRPKKGAKLRIISLGGLHEIGKNMTAIEYGDDIIVVDSGFGFPDEDMLGVDYVIPDITYLEKNASRVRGILITHGHEDHIGAIPYVLKSINPPIYGTRLTLGIIRNKLAEHRLPAAPRLMTVEAGDCVQLGVFLVEFIHVNHSIADACALAIRTPLGMVYHSGDFKLDITPIDGNMMDLTRIGALGNEGVLLYLGESTNAERAGYSPSERSVGGSLEQIFRENKDNRLIVATFSSNVHRVQQIIDCSIKFGRRVAILGRSMENVIGAAVELGYMQVPAGTIVDVSEIRRFAPGQVTLITTGSQGEPMSGLYRMAFGSHDRVKLGESDTVVLSSSAIPGNELLVDRIINALIKSGIKVVSDATTANVHASGHACAEELKLLHALLRPKYFMPIHGEMRHLYAHKKLAEYMGMPSERIFIQEIGEVLEIDEDGARKNGTVPAGRVLVDGAGVGDVGAIVLRDRQLLSQDGLIVVVATVAMKEKMLLSGPDIVSRGFVYVRESEEMMENARNLAQTTLEKRLQSGCHDWTELKNALRDELSRFFFRETKRRPMILPIVMDV